MFITVSAGAFCTPMRWKMALSALARPAMRAKTYATPSVYSSRKGNHRKAGPGSGPDLPHRGPDPLSPATDTLCRARGTTSEAVGHRTRGDPEMTVTEQAEPTSAAGSPTPDEFEAGALAFLDANAEKRPEEVFVWGQGSDDVSLFPERSPELSLI